MVRAGYKQTEVGVIPEDWEVRPLKEFLAHAPKYGINASAKELKGNLPIYIRITDINEEGKFQPSIPVGVDHPYAGNYFLQKGDIVIARTGASVGKSYLYVPADGLLVFAGFLIKITSNKKLLASYLSQYLKTEYYWNWVKTTSMRSGQPGINGNEYASLLISCPLIKEQTAIATALSDIDALITTLTELIDKKRQIKTATMQQLLTGKQRLAGFGEGKGMKSTELGEIPEDWGIVKIKEVATIDPENLSSSTNLDYEFSYISLENVEHGKLLGTLNYIFKESPSRARRVIRKNDVLISTVRPNLMSHLFINCEVKNTICSTGFSVIRCNKQGIPQYLYQLFFSSIVNTQINNLISGSNYPAISSQNVKNGHDSRELKSL
jgi:type I restriction enzyme S subunit